MGIRAGDTEGEGGVAAAEPIVAATTVSDTDGAAATPSLPDADALPLELPLDVVLAACMHLPARDVASALCACESWHGALVGSEELWSRLCAAEWDYWSPAGHCSASSPKADAPVIPGFGSWHAVFCVRAPAPVF